MPLGTDAIRVSLGLPELAVLTVDQTEKSVEIAVKRKHDFEICPKCGKSSDRIHDQWITKVRDLPMSGKATYLLVHKRRFRCVTGCKPFAEVFGCLFKYQRQTKRCREFLESGCRHSSLSSASRKLAVGYKQLDGIYYKRAHAKADDFKAQSLPRVLGVDEFSGKRRVRMHVILTDLSQKPAKLWDVIETKSAVTFYKFFEKYNREERDAVEVIVHDMDQGLKAWTRTMFKKAIHVVDKFHVTRTLLKHLESVRKKAYRKSESYWNKKKIRSAYFLIRKRRKDLTEEQQVQLEELFTISKPMQEAYELKESFMSWYDTPQRRHAAQRELDYLYDRIKETPGLKGFCWTLDNWGAEILNYFALPYTNAFTEGMNNKIKTLKRQAYGFRNFNRFRTRILTECGLY